MITVLTFLLTFFLQPAPPTSTNTQNNTVTPQQSPVYILD